MVTALSTPLYAQEGETGSDSTEVNNRTLEEVIVTATKTKESIQDVPLAISAFDGNMMRDVQLDDVKDLASITPGVDGNSHDSFIDSISVRGIRTNDFGVGGDPSVGFFKNNLYEGRNGVVVSSLYDMDRSEVLRGPQGFLFGRNAIAGAFSSFTTRPDQGGRDGYFELDIAERSHIAFEGGTNFTLTDNFSMRAAAYHSEEDGYSRNAYDGKDYIGHDKSSIRLSGLYETDNLSVFTMFEYEDRKQSGSIYRATGLDNTYATLQDIQAFNMPRDGRDFNSDLNLGNTDEGEIFNFGMEIQYDMDWATLVSNTGYKDHDYFYAEDFDSTPIAINGYQQDQSGTYFQQELRLQSNNDGPLSWYAGASYYQEEIDVLFNQAGDEEVFCAYYGAYYGVDNCSDYFSYWQDYYGPSYGIPNFVASSDGSLTEANDIRAKNSGWAAYVNVDYMFNDQWDASLGMRYTYDKKKFRNWALPVESLLGPFFINGFTSDGYLTDTKTWDKFTPRLSVRYRPNDDTMIYASATEGYKSGGFGTFSIDPAIYQWFGDGPDDPITQSDGFRPAPFKPETVTSFELGLKQTIFGGNSRYSISAFAYEYEDLQVTYFDQGTKVDNVGKASAHGLEFTFNTLMGEYFDLYLGASWLDSEVTGLELICDAIGPNGYANPSRCEGQRIWWSPEYTAVALLNGHINVGGGEIFGNLQANYESERGGGWSDRAESILDSNTLLALRVGYRMDNNWTFTGYIENLTDELIYDGSANDSAIQPAMYFGPNAPRTFGVKVGYSWD
ncbi:MAG: TonB-dependent receptor [Proteobacteria bacterium]|nr:TonB-dependent receptor [Pseudomonadota bacterium]